PGPGLWARPNPFTSPSRVQICGSQVCTRALQRCCATNTRTVAHSQYFSFSLCTPSARCAVTFQASRASRDMSVRSHMMGKYRSPGDCRYKMRFELLPNDHGHIFPLSFPRARCCTVDKAAVFWQLGGDALSVCIYRTLMEMCHPSPLPGFSLPLCSLRWGHQLVLSVAMQRATVLGTDHRPGRHLQSKRKKPLHQPCLMLLLLKALL
uniref:Uncharacterized protein n=1 Tax=Buteo japonicus TaxID=224669 RepID=A0A8C0B2C5_9AVES